MEIECDEVGGCGTPFLMEEWQLHVDILSFVQFAHHLAPSLEKAGVSAHQFYLLWAMYYGGTRTVAVLAGIAGVDPQAARADIEDLERRGFVTVEAPPTRYETPRVERTDRWEAVYAAVAPVNERLEQLRHDVFPDPAHPWQGPTRPL